MCIRDRNNGWDQNWCCNGEGEDFGFYHPHPDFDHKLVRNYAKEKNIRIVGHHETGTQIENYESQLDSAFAYCKRNGIRVVKTGYVNDGSKNIKRTGADGKIYKEWHHGVDLIPMLIGLFRSSPTRYQYIFQARSSSCSIIYWVR